MFRRKKSGIEVPDSNLLMESNKLEVPFEIIPERLRLNGNLDIGNIACGTITSYSFHDGNLYGKINENVEFLINQEDFCSLPYFSETEIPSVLLYSIGKKVCGKIIELSENCIKLDRLTILEETMSILSKQIGSTVVCTIESIAPYGVFVDLGNGVECLLHCTEASLARYEYMENYFHVGDKIKVILTSYDPLLRRFEISRKKAYSKLDLEPSSIFKAKVCERANSNGYFVEVNPMTIGIVDVPYDLKLAPNTEISCIIKRISESGFHGDLISIL